MQFHSDNILYLESQSLLKPMVLRPGLEPRLGDYQSPVLTNYTISAYGGPGGIRTRDTRIKSPLPLPLCYWPILALYLIRSSYIEDGHTPQISCAGLLYTPKTISGTPLSSRAILVLFLQPRQHIPFAFFVCLSSFCFFSRADKTDFFSKFKIILNHGTSVQSPEIGLNCCMALMQKERNLVRTQYVFILSQFSIARPVPIYFFLMEPGMGFEPTTY